MKNFGETPLAEVPKTVISKSEVPEPETPEKNERKVLESSKHGKILREVLKRGGVVDGKVQEGKIEIFYDNKLLGAIADNHIEESMLTDLLQNIQKGKIEIDPTTKTIDELMNMAYEKDEKDREFRNSPEGKMKGVVNKVKSELDKKEWELLKKYFEKK